MVQLNLDSMLQPNTADGLQFNETISVSHSQDRNNPVFSSVNIIYEENSCDLNISQLEFESDMLIESLEHS